MKNLLFFFIICLTLCYSAMMIQAQNTIWERTFPVSGGGEGSGNSLAIDAAGNVYTTGYFSGTADFDPGPGTFNLTSAGSDDIFVSKLDASGNFLWAKRMGGVRSDVSRGIAIDAASNVYTTGYFIGTADFDPGSGTFNLTPGEDYDIFVSKLDASGNFLWAKRMGGIDGDFGFSIALDVAGNVYTTGGFSVTVDFDPGSGTFNLTSDGLRDIFVSKLDASGNFLWAKRMGGGDNEFGFSIAIDADGNVYTTGQFGGTADFDPGSGTFNLTSAGSADIFVSKLDASGNFLWAKRMGGTGYDVSSGIALDAAGNVYTTGHFGGTADFDPGSGTFNLTSAGSADIFVSKLDASGNFLWAKGMGGTDFDRGRGIALDAIRNVHISGDLGTSIFLAKRCPVDYNPQVSIQVSDADLKICQGELLTLTALVQDNTDNPPRVWRRNGLVVGNSNILASNAFNNGDRIALELVYPGFENGYDATCIRNNTASVVVEVRPVVTPSVIIGITSSGLACQGKPVVFKAITTNGGERPSYVWLRKNVGQANFSVVGTNLDNYETSSLANGDIIRVELTNTDIPNCATGKVNTVTSPDFVVGITPSLTASVNLTANIRQGQPICNSDTLVFTAQPVNQGDSPSYEWFINNSKVATTNTPSFRTNQFPANTNPINVYVRMTSNYPCLTNNPVNSPNFSFRTQSSTTPALSLQALDGTSICAGELARFKANPIGGGVEPSYQWFINEAPQGNLSTQDIFGSITFRDGDVIRAEMVSDLNCASPPIVSSAPLVISVRPAPNVEIKSNSGLVVCQGAALTLEAVPSNATSPTYQWRKNGENIVGATNRTYTFNNIQASDNQASIDVVMNSTNVTCKNSRVIANPINLQVSNAFVPSVNLRARQGAVLCEGSLAIFEIASLNVPAATYEWRVDNVVKSTQPLFEAGVLQAGQKVRLSITTTLACANPKTATSTEYVVRTQTLQKPTNLTANTVGNRAIELRWQDNSTGETRFVIERAIGSDNPQNFVTFRNVLDTVSTFFTDTDVLPNTTYFYRVRAVNANIPDCRSAYSDRVGATTDGEDLVTANSPNLETVLEVYPNPSQSGIFYLQWTTGWAGEIKLALFNVLQAQSFGQVLQKNAQSTQTTLDLSHYSAGVYWLKIQVNGRSRFVKLVKY